MGEGLYELVDLTIITGFRDTGFTSVSCDGIWLSEIFHPG